MITSGTTTINPLALKDYTKEQVRELLKGKLADDFEIIYAKICEVTGGEPIVNIDNDKAPTNSTKRKKS